MLDRNRRIKKFPEKFQNCTERFDIIITAEERVYDQVIEFMESKEPVYNQPVHVINMDIQVKLNKMSANRSELTQKII